MTFLDIVKRVTVPMVNELLAQDVDIRIDRWKCLSEGDDTTTIEWNREVGILDRDLKWLLRKYVGDGRREIVEHNGKQLLIDKLSEDEWKAVETDAIQVILILDHYMPCDVVKLFKCLIPNMPSERELKVLISLAPHFIDYVKVSVIDAYLYVGTSYTSRLKRSVISAIIVLLITGNLPLYSDGIHMDELVGRVITEDGELHFEPVSVHFLLERASWIRVVGMDSTLLSAFKHTVPGKEMCNKLFKIYVSRKRRSKKDNDS